MDPAFQFQGPSQHARPIGSGQPRRGQTRLTWRASVRLLSSRLSAETPSFWVANIQQVVNQTVSGVRSDSKMVPVVTDVRLPQPEHQNRPPPSRQPPWSPHPGQTNPVGQGINSR